MENVDMTPHPKQHGGARKGAGRPPRDTPREAITVRLEPEHATKLRALCKARSLSQANWITDKIKRAIITNQ